MSPAVILKPLKVFLRESLNDELHVVRQYKQNFGQLPDLSTPTTFSEKIQFQKLYNRDPKMTVLADKYLVREYISSMGAGHILNDLIGAYDDPEDIDFDTLPDQFVIKCNHSWATNIICENKNELDRRATVASLRQWMGENHYFSNREWAYKNIKPKIIIEKYLSGNLKDYKFFCFSGEPTYIQIDKERFSGHTLDLYDMNWNRLNCTKGDVPNQDQPDLCPPFFDEMYEIAKQLSGIFNFCRFDFLATDDDYYFGEVTFYPGGGLTAFNPYSYDIEFGRKLDISQLNVPVTSKAKLKLIKAMDQLGFI